MATVKLTYDLKSEIRAKIHRAYEPRFLAVKNEIEQMFTFDELMTEYINETGGTAIYEQCTQWLALTNRLWVSRVNGVRWDTHVTKHREWAGTPMWPDNAVIPSLAHKSDRLKELYTQKDTLNDEYNNTVNNVLETIAQYGSVNSALKAHPDLQHLLPSYTIEKINEVKEKRVRAPVEARDLSNIASVAVLARLAEAR
jgi:hypothetical protein